MAKTKTKLVTLSPPCFFPEQLSFWAEASPGLRSMLGPVFQIIALLRGLWDSFRLAEPENGLALTRELLWEGGGREREEVAISDTVAAQ